MKLWGGGMLCRRPVNHIHDIAEKLFVGHAVGGLGGKFNLGAEMQREFAE